MDAFINEISLYKCLILPRPCSCWCASSCSTPCSTGPSPSRRTPTGCTASSSRRSAEVNENPPPFTAPLGGQGRSSWRTQHHGLRQALRPKKIPEVEVEDSRSYNNLFEDLSLEVANAKSFLLTLFSAQTRTGRGLGPARKARGPARYPKSPARPGLRFPARQ